MMVNKKKVEKICAEIGVMRHIHQLSRQPFYLGSLIHVSKGNSSKVLMFAQGNRKEDIYATSLADDVNWARGKLGF